MRFYIQAHLDRDNIMREAIATRGTIWLVLGVNTMRESMWETILEMGMVPVF